MVEKFIEWAENALQDAELSNVVALNFNLYEDQDSFWAVEIVGTSSFDENDADWACDEVFVTRDNPFTWEEETDSDAILKEVTEWIGDLLDGTVLMEMLDRLQGIGVGFEMCIRDRCMNCLRTVSVS